MPDAWYTFLSTLCARAYFARIRVIGAERLPRGGPILYAGLHRNGAVDGFIYKSIFRRAIFLIAAQLQNNLFSRIFFTGIPVIRDKDSGDRGMNAEAMERSGELLASGGELFVFPEGTSSLGPQHLPFKSGAARIAVEAWQEGVPLKVVPLGITYNAPSMFRSSVEVIVGEAIGAEQLMRPVGEEHPAKAKKAITRALETLGINAESAEYFEELRMIARVALPGRSYFHAMKLCERGIPEELQASWVALRDEMRGSNLKQSEAASAFSAAPPWISLFAGILFAPFVAVGATLNFLPLAGAYWAGKKFSDAPNVITLWRILAGVPLFFLWFVAVFAGLAIAGRGAWILVFLLLTEMGWLAYQPMRQFLVAGWNGIRFPELRGQYLEFQKLLLTELGKHEF
jgi:1-acyl-sn-glycerol-3-phosphate acyltransferase